MGAFSVPDPLRFDNHSLDVVLLLLCTYHHRFFAEHHILNALFIVADTFIAIGNFADLHPHPHEQCGSVISGKYRLIV
ncbi:MAG: hypothetical protein NC405_04395 [Odoribacter sp.]|nr:hypothetical protein [Odoribacter sp.]